jgi:hypothetical protein
MEIKDKKSFRGVSVGCFRLSCAVVILPTALRFLSLSPFRQVSLVTTHRVQKGNCPSAHVFRIHSIVIINTQTYGVSNADEGRCTNTNLRGDKMKHKGIFSEATLRQTSRKNFYNISPLGDVNGGAPGGGA